MVDQTGPKPPAKPPRKYNSKFRQGKSAVPATREDMSPLWQAVLDKIGGEQGVLDAAMASQNPKAKILAELILDKSYKTQTLDTKARKAGLSRADIVDMFRDKQWLLTTVALYDSLPEIVADAAVDAKATYIPCEECKGVSSSPPCYACGGSGKVRRPGDKEKLRFIGEAAGMVGKPNPLFQQNNLQINNNVTGKSFEDLMRAASVNERQKKAIEGIQEAEVISQST